MTGADVVAEAREWIGTKWMHGQSLKGVGTDCLGLVSGVGLALNVEGSAKWRSDARMRGYARRPDVRLVLRACNDYLDPLRLAAVNLGSILWLCREGATHFAIVSRVRPLYIVHGLAEHEVCENRVDDWWWSHIRRAYRFRGLIEPLKFGVAGACVDLSLGPLGKSIGWAGGGSCVGSVLFPEKWAS